MITRARPLLFLAGATVLVFWKVIFHGEFTLLAGGDMATSYFPWFDVASYWLKRGVFLLWDPYVYSGKLNMGEPQPGIFYPLNWIFMILPAKGGGANAGGLQALLILNYFLAACFTYRLARSLELSRAGSVLAGIAFAFGGFMAVLYGYLNVLSGFAWMPLTLYFYRLALRQRSWRSRLPRIAGAGVCLAATFLPGHHTAPIHTGFLLFIFTLFFALRERAGLRRWATFSPFVSLALTGIAALALTVFQWLPSALWATRVFRWVGLGEPVRWGEKVPYSILEQTSNLAPQDAVSLVLPYLSTNVNLYSGLFVAALAAVGFLVVRRPETMFFGVAGILYFLLSWGRFSALHGWANSMVPGLWFARELFFYLIPLQLCIALLAGYGFDRVCEIFASGESSPGQRAWIVRTGWVLAAVVLFSGGLVALLAYGSGLPMDHPYILALGGLGSWCLIAGVLLFFVCSGRISATAFGTLIVLATVLDLSSRLSMDIRLKSATPGQENTYVRSYWKKPPVAERLIELRQAEVFRVDDPSGIFPPNYGDAWRLDATMGHGATALVDYFTFRGTGWSPASNASALLNVAYFPSRIPIAGMERLAGEGDPLYRNPRAVPRAFAAARYRCFGQRNAMLAWLGSPLFAPRDVVLLERGEFERLPAEFRVPRFNDDEAIDVRLVHYRRGTEQPTEQPDTYQAPFGWGPGDEAVLALKPRERGLRWFVAFTYRNRAGEPSGPLKLSLTSATDSRELVVDLGAGDRWMEARADLGILEQKDYRLSFAKAHDCRALLDSFRVTRSDQTDPAAGSVSVLSRKPNRVQLRAFLTRPAFVVLSEIYYPGWEAFVDGENAPLLRGDYILRTIPVPAGEHTIELRFRPAVFRWGLIASLCFAAFGIAAVYLSTRH